MTEVKEAAAFSYVQRIPLCQDSWGGKRGGHGLSDVVGAGGPCLGLHVRLRYSSLTPGNVGHLWVLAELFFAVCPHRRHLFTRCASAASKYPPLVSWQSALLGEKHRITQKNGMPFVSKKQTVVSLSVFNSCNEVKVIRESWENIVDLPKKPQLSRLFGLQKKELFLSSSLFLSLLHSAFHLFSLFFAPLLC